MTYTDKILEQFIERGANLEHQRWSRWQKYLHSLCTPHTINSLNAVTKQYDDINTGGLVISEARLKHWDRQISLPYDDLTEQEKEYDRVETRNYLPLLDDLIHQAVAEERARVKEYLNHYKTKSDCCSQTVDNIYTSLKDTTKEDEI